MAALVSIGGFDFPEPSKRYNRASTKTMYTYLDKI